MDFTELNDIPGLLVIIDFEKAFNSVKEMYSRNSRIFDFCKWIKSYRCNSNLCVTKTGFLSNFFLECECQQSNPISRNSFIMCIDIDSE